MHAVKAFGPDLVLLDLTLKDGGDGLVLCERLTHAHERLPIIIISARGEKEDRVRGLGLGADDYLVKPFELDELLARIQAVLRRSRGRTSALRLGDVYIDFVRRAAFKGRREIILTDREFEIMRYLADRRGTVVTRDELLHLVWGYDEAPLTRTVDNFIFHLRKKLEPDPKHPVYIRTAYGDGYRLTVGPE
jgi:two-component system, OmpR family, alkaline phosphatase synthesis response regulator PhoP